jgi:hypothetical protein
VDGRLLVLKALLFGAESVVVAVEFGTLLGNWRFKHERPG